MGTSMEAADLSCAVKLPAIIFIGCGGLIPRATLERLKKRGFGDAKFIAPIDAAKHDWYPHAASLIFLYEGEMLDENETSILKAMRAGGCRELVAVLSLDPSLNDLLKAIKDGADDYLFLGGNLDLVEEAQRLMAKPSRCGRCWHPEAIGQTGIFRSFGLTERQIEILIEYSRDFPRSDELAKRLHISDRQLRKVFSRIYEKLDGPLAVNSSARLTKLLTICSSGLG